MNSEIEAKIAKIMEDEEFVEQKTLQHLLKSSREAFAYAEKHPTTRNWRIAESRYEIYMKEWHRLNPEEHSPLETGEE